MKRVRIIVGLVCGVFAGACLTILGEKATESTKKHQPDCDCVKVTAVGGFMTTFAVLLSWILAGPLSLVGWVVGSVTNYVWRSRSAHLR